MTADKPNTAPRLMTFKVGISVGLMRLGGYWSRSSSHSVFRLVPCNSGTSVQRPWVEGEADLKPKNERS
jgi:hypothetical protein